MKTLFSITYEEGSNEINTHLESDGEEEYNGIITGLVHLFMNNKQIFNSVLFAIDKKIKEEEKDD